MNSYKEIRQLSAISLRELCIRQNWYTSGSNEEYRHLLLDLASHNQNLTTEDIIEIAADIAAHSDLPEDYDIGNIAWEVNRVCNTYFLKQ